MLWLLDATSKTAVIPFDYMNLIRIKSKVRQFSLNFLNTSSIFGQNEAWRFCFPLALRFSTKVKATDWGVDGQQLTVP